MNLITRTATIIALILTFAPSRPAAAAPAESQRYFRHFFEFNSCEGELVELNGIAHVVTKPNKDGTTTYHATFHATGIAEDSENEYIYNDLQIYTLGQGEIETTFEGLLVSKGPLDNERVLVYFNSETGDFFVETICTG